jgi:predicted TIM-barrel enzyme
MHEVGYTLRCNEIALLDDFQNRIFDGKIRAENSGLSGQIVPNYFDRPFKTVNWRQVNLLL